MPFAIESSQDLLTSNSSIDELQAKHYTKLSIKLEQEQTKHKRPILFIVPARAETQLHYSIHGKNKDLFGLRPDADGVWTLYYNHPVNILQEEDPVTHHVRVIGTKSRLARHNHESTKDLNMKVKIVIVRK